MIVFDLRCHHGHRFEGWFSSTGDFESQHKRGLLNCPECGSTSVSKAPMAPSVPAKGNTITETLPQRKTVEDGPVISNQEMPAEVQAAITKLAQAQARVLKDSKWVGSDFAEQSREMHYGERDEAPIHGQASLKEAKELAEEGVPIAPLPFPVSPPDKLN